MASRARVSAVAHLQAMVAGTEDDSPIWALIERLLINHEGDKDVEAACFILAGALGTVRKLRKPK